jgi:hypothetical protein
MSNPPNRATDPKRRPKPLARVSKASHLNIETEEGDFGFIVDPSGVASKATTLTTYKPGPKFGNAAAAEYWTNK